MKTILVIDDETGFANVLTAILEDEGFRIIVAGNGHEALLRLAESIPDLILLDFMMPVMAGPGFLRALEKDPRLQEIPIIVMSAVGEPAVRRSSDNFFAYLQKPFETGELMHKVREALNKT